MGYFPDGYIYNLQISNNVINPNFQIDIAGGRCKSDDNMFDSSVATPITVDLTVAGVNGLDAGVEAVSTWYYPWIIATSAGTPAGLISTSYTNPVLPAGFIYKRRMGSFYNDGAGNINVFTVRGNLNERIVYRNTTMHTGSGYTLAILPNYTTISLSSVVPPTAKKVLLELADWGSLNNYSYLYTKLPYISGESERVDYCTSTSFQRFNFKEIFIHDGWDRNVYWGKGINNAELFQLYIRNYTEYL